MTLISIPIQVNHDGRLNDSGYLQKVRIKGRLASIFVRFWVSGLRVEKIGWENNQRAKSLGGPVLYVLWHGSQVVPLANFRNRGIIILTSLSRDGDIQDVSMNCLGFRTIRGSSSRGGARALLSLMKELPNAGFAAITVDGPRGPYHVAKPGAVLLAQKTGAAVLPVGVAHSLCHRMKNWDRFEIPFPFSRSILVTGEPFFVDSHLSLENGAALIEEKISECDKLAKERIGG